MPRPENPIHTPVSFLFLPKEKEIIEHPKREQAHQPRPKLRPHENQTPASLPGLPATRSSRDGRTRRAATAARSIIAAVMIP